MKPYLICLVAGVAVGLLYGLFNVKSPAPPIVALVGLLGMLGGEYIAPAIKNLVSSIYKSNRHFHAEYLTCGSFKRRYGGLTPLL
jgi:XapX domain-containing protein